MNLIESTTKPYLLSRIFTEGKNVAEESELEVHSRRRRRKRREGERGGRGRGGETGLGRRVRIRRNWDRIE